MVLQISDAGNKRLAVSLFSEGKGEVSLPFRSSAHSGDDLYRRSLMPSCSFMVTTYLKDFVCA